MLPVCANLHSVASRRLLRRMRNGGHVGIGAVCAKLGPAIGGIARVAKDRQAHGGVLSPSGQRALAKFQREAREASTACAREGLVHTIRKPPPPGAGNADSPPSVGSRHSSSVWGLASAWT